MVRLGRRERLIRDVIPSVRSSLTVALLCVLAAGCGDTVDAIDADRRPDRDFWEVSTDSFDEGETEGESMGADGSFASCAQLDLLFVVDDAAANASMLATLRQSMGPLETLLRGPGRPWAHDFHVGVVSTQGDRSRSECHTGGALSMQPRGATQACVTAGGQPWASSDDAHTQATLGCLSALGTTGDQPRRVVEAIGRGLGSPLAGDDLGEQVVAECNDGFHRPGALTMLVVVTSDDDLGSPASVQQWSQVFEGVGAPEIVVAMLPLSGVSSTCPGPANRLNQWFDESGAVVLDWCAPTVEAIQRLSIELEQQLGARCSS